MAAGTKHNSLCSMAYGKLSPMGQCPRCDELAHGAKPRPAPNWLRRPKVPESERIRAIRAHNCQASQCGPVCTAFDW
jgi:hypothetical protein